MRICRELTVPHKKEKVANPMSEVRNQHTLPNRTDSQPVDGTLTASATG